MVSIRVVNVYSPTDVSSDNMKDSFYKLLQKACKKSEKHEKLIILGDLNAKTSLALKNCCMMDPIFLSTMTVKIMGKE